MRLVFVAISAAFCAACCSITLGLAGAAANRPLAESPEDKARYEAAIALHDRGEYEAAASAFRDLLVARPDDPDVLCELANSLMSSGKAEEAIRHAERALDQPGVNVAFCSMILGSALDAQGDLKKGEKAFRKGLNASPDAAMLHFNLGVNQSQQKRPAEAIGEFQEAVRLKPSLASGWRALALSWQAQQLRPRAFAAFARFLTLEPEGPRAEAAARQLEALLFQGVENKGTDPKTGKGNISVTIPTGGKDDAVSALGMSMSIVAATRWVEEWEKRSDAEFYAHGFESVLKIFQRWTTPAVARTSSGVRR